MNRAQKLSAAVAVLSVVLLTPILTYAETVVRTGNTISVASDQVVAEDLYVAANTLSVSGTVEGDVHAAANQFTANGTLGSDVLVVGNSVNIHAPVADDVRAAAGEVVIADQVGGDVFVFAGSLKVLSTASIAGDVFFFGESATIEGVVSGSVMGTYRTLRLNAEVGEDVDVTVHESLTLGERAMVTGNVTYESSAQMVRAQESVIEGTVVQNTPTVPNSAPSARGILLPFLISLFGSLTVYLLFRRHMLRFVDRHAKPVPLRALIGLVTLAALPLMSIMLIVTVLGLWLGVATLFFFGALLFASYLLVPVLVGSGVYALVSGKVVVNTLTVLVGAVIVHAVLYVPVVGVVAVFVALCTVVGAIVTALYHLAR